MTDDSARNIAKIILRRHLLEPPVDIFSVLRNYAEVEIVEIPFEFDGIALDLSGASKPRVILNERGVLSRKRFTAAHELGHVLIPWHQGAFFDDADDIGEQLWRYAEMEREANAFASEILMPSAWIVEKSSKQRKLSAIHKSITSEAGVSPQAAAINLAHALPAGCVFACVDAEEIVVNSGKSPGTHALTPKWGRVLSDDLYSYAEEHSTYETAYVRFEWWRLPAQISVDEVNSNSSSDDWRQLLDEIVDSAGLKTSEKAKLKSSVNGVVAFVNGRCKSLGGHSADTIMAAAMQRFHDRPEYKSICGHPLFNRFLVARIRSLLA